MKKLKIAITLILSLAVMFTLIACTDAGDKKDDGNQNEEQNGNAQNESDNNSGKDVNPNEVMTAISAIGILTETETFTNEDGGTELDADSASFYFGTMEEDPDMSIVKDYALSSAIGYSADEVGVFVVDKEGDAEKVKEYFLTRIGNIKTKFKDYDTKEYEKAMNATVKIEGNVVYYIISNDNKQIENKIKEFIK